MGGNARGNGLPATGGALRVHVPVAATAAGRDRGGQDITADYRAGILEIRIPEPKGEEPKKIPVGKS